MVSSMTCGIYQLTFQSGMLYIGQSVNIENRWAQHFDKFQKGTAAKSMQQEFNRVGSPSAEILLVCHKDHLDMMETMYIHSRLDQVRERVLNTSIPACYSDEDVAIATSDDTYLKVPITALIKGLKSAKANMANLQEEVDALHDKGIQTPEAIRKVSVDNAQLKSDVSKLLIINQELSRKANMNWLERLFS